MENNCEVLHLTTYFRTVLQRPLLWNPQNSKFLNLPGSSVFLNLYGPPTISRIYLLIYTSIFVCLGQLPINTNATFLRLWIGRIHGTFKPLDSCHHFGGKSHVPTVLWMEYSSPTERDEALLELQTDTTVATHCSYSHKSQYSNHLVGIMNFPNLTENAEERQDCSPSGKVVFHVASQIHTEERQWSLVC